MNQYSKLFVSENLVIELAEIVFIFTDHLDNKMRVGISGGYEFVFGVNDITLELRSAWIEYKSGAAPVSDELKDISISVRGSSIYFKITGVEYKALPDPWGGTNLFYPNGVSAAPLKQKELFEEFIKTDHGNKAFSLAKIEAGFNG